MKSVTINKRSILVGVGLVAVLAGMLIAVTVLAAPLGRVTPLGDGCARTDSSCLQAIAAPHAGNDACARTDSACLAFTRVSAASVAGNDSCARTDSACLPFTQVSAASVAGNDACARTDSACLPFTQVSAASVAGNDACARTDSACLPFTQVSAASAAGNDACARTDSACIPFTQIAAHPVATVPALGMAAGPSDVSVSHCAAPGSAIPYPAASPDSDPMYLAIASHLSSYPIPYPPADLDGDSHPCPAGNTVTVSGATQVQRSVLSSSDAVGTVSQMVISYPSADLNRDSSGSVVRYAIPYPSADLDGDSSPSTVRYALPYPSADLGDGDAYLVR